MGYYTTTVTTDSGGNATNLDANSNPVWNGIFRGALMGVRVTFGASPDAGTDTTVSEPSGMSRTIHTFTNVSTATNVHPVIAADGVTNATMPYYIESTNLKITVASGGNAKTITVGVLVWE